MKTEFQIYTDNKFNSYVVKLLLASLFGLIPACLSLSIQFFGSAAEGPALKYIVSGSTQAGLVVVIGAAITSLVVALYALPFIDKPSIGEQGIRRLFSIGLVWLCIGGLYLIAGEYAWGTFLLVILAVAAAACANAWRASIK